ncbi:MAG: sigma-70 family RNA polymerase sigma factor [Polyangia bacterium]
MTSRKPRLNDEAAEADAGAGSAAAAGALAPAGGEVERRALAGDRDAWSALIARHDRKVVVALLARGVAIEQAKDLAQETWLRLIESQRAGRLSSLSLPGLAIVQAGYLLRNAQRAEGARGTTALFAGSADEDADRDGAAPPDPQPLAEERVLQRDRVQRVAGALATCPPSARRVFEFVYDHPELSYPEVAARFGLSTQRVKQTVCEVRKRLRAALVETDRDRDEEA